MGLEKGGLETKMKQSRFPLDHYRFDTVEYLSLYCSTSFCEDLPISISSLHRWSQEIWCGWLLRTWSKGRFWTQDVCRFLCRCPQIFKNQHWTPNFLVGMTFPEPMHAPLTCSVAKYPVSSWIGGPAKSITPRRDTVCPFRPRQAVLGQTAPQTSSIRKNFQPMLDVGS